MRRSLSTSTTLATAALITAGLAAPAGAAAPTYDRGDTTDWSCVLDTAPLVEMQGALDALGESRVEVFVQNDDGFLAPDWERAPDLTVTESTVTGSIPMLRYRWDTEPVPAAPATVDLTLTRLGEPETFRDRPNTNENVRVETVSSTQRVSVSGSVSVAGSTYAISGCEGTHETYVSRTTTPDSTVGGIGSGGSYEAFCLLGDGQGAMQLLRDGKDSAGFFETFGEPSAFGEIVEAVWRPGELRGTYTVDGGGTAAARVTAGELLDDGKVVESLGPFRRTFSYEQYAASGRLELSDGTGWDLTCELLVTTGMSMLHSPSGPAVDNDAPDDAIPLADGETVELRTGSTVRAAEVGTACAESELSHTVWYSVEGSGADVTVDTTGSGFDTVVAVYVDAGGELLEIACGNDDEDAFAAVTWLAEAGMEYLVQVGGPDGHSGRLVLSRG